MKKNTLILAGLVLILGGLVYYFQVLQDDNNSISDGKEWQRSFAIEDPSAIETIFISKLSGLKIKLTRDGEYWKVNDKYMANPNVMKNLINTAVQLELQRTPIAKEANNIVKSLSANGTNVKYFDKDGNIIKAYYLGGSDLEGTGTEIMMEGSNQPYIVNVPYFQGILSFRFNKPEREFRDRSIFRMDPSSIYELSIEYPKQKSKSFKLIKDEGDFYVEQYFDLKGKGRKKVNQNIIDQYLAGFELKIAEGIENNNPVQDSVLSTMPFCRIELKYGDGLYKKVSFFEIEELNDNGEKVTEIISRLFCYIEPEDDFMLTQLNPIKELLRPYDYF